MKKFLILLSFVFVGSFLYACSPTDTETNVVSNDLITKEINSILEENNLGYDLCYRKKGGSYSSDYYFISFKRMNVTTVGVVYSKKNSKDIKSIVILTCCPINGSLQDGWVIEDYSSYIFKTSDDGKRVYSFKDEIQSKEYYVVDVSNNVKYVKSAIKNRTNDDVYQTLTGRKYNN